MTDSETPTLLGFAQPVVAPLAEPTAEQAITSGPAPMPELATPTTAVPLEALAPRPADQRDPLVPLVELDPVAEQAPAWTPDQPLMDLTAEVDPALLPPPTGAPVVPAQPAAEPARARNGAPWAPPVDPATPWSANPGTGMAPSPVQGWPGNTTVAPRHVERSWSTTRRPGTLGVLGWALVLVGLAWLMPSWAWLDLGLAAGVLLRGRLPGRLLVTASALIAIYLQVQWWLGYLATSTLETSVRILVLATGAGLLLLHLQQARRA